jgi:hypothetical protein
MTDAQILTIALATAPTMITVLIGILINNSRISDLNARMGDLNASVNGRFGSLDGRFGELRAYMDLRFNDVDRRLDEMKDMWRSELHRVEEVLDARLKHLEER